MQLSIAPLKLIPQSTMVESPQFGAQKAAGSSNKAISEGKLVPTCQILDLNSVMPIQAM